MTAVRVDKWLWAVRVYKTRSQANEACAGGRVRINGDPAKPAARVAPGDVVEARRRDRTVTVEVIEPIEKRVSATVAATCFIDHSPPSPGADGRGLGLVVIDGVRERGAGRPTKRDRRQIDAWRRAVGKDRR